MFSLILVFLFTSYSSPNPLEKKTDEKVELSKKSPCECPGNKNNPGETTDREVNGSGEAIPLSGKMSKRPRLSQEERNEAAAKMEKLFDALEEVVEEIPRDTFDPQAIVDKVGSEPEALFRWVRDNTFLVPYEGTLRGPIGVLMDRMGNSLDRALLLYELLNLAGHEARLARGALSKEQVIDIQKKVNPISKRETDSQKPISHQDIDNLIEKYSAKIKLDKAQLKKRFEDLTRKQAEMEKTINKRVKEQTAAIYEAVKKYRKDDPAEEENRKIKALQDHWWVVIEGEDDWIHLDPTLPGNELGKRIVEEENTYYPEDLDEDMVHLVDIRVIAEKWEDGEFEDNTVLEHTLRPSELFGKQISLSHIPMNWPKDLNLFSEKDPVEKLKKIVLDEKEWMPVLKVGTDIVHQSSIMRTGEINESPGEEQGISRGVGGLLDGFNQALGGDDTEEEEGEDSFLTAEWIEYEIKSPGGESKKIRRRVFDLINPVLRREGDVGGFEISEEKQLKRGLGLFCHTQIFLQVCDLSLNFIAHLMAENMLSNREILLDLFRHTDLKKDLFEHLSNLSPLPGPGYSLAYARQEWGRSSNSVYLNCPNILSFFRDIHQGPQGAFVSTQGYDIIDNRVAVLPGSKTDPFQTRLEQGVLDTNAESLLLGDAGTIKENAAELFIISKSQGIEWLTIGDAHNQSWKNSKLPKDARLNIEQDLADGYTVVAPAKAVMIETQPVTGWWRIDPGTGDTMGILQGGRGGSLVEYKALRKYIFGTTLSILCLIARDPGWKSVSCLIAWHAGTVGYFLLLAKSVKIQEIGYFIIDIVIFLNGATISIDMILNK